MVNYFEETMQAFNQELIQCIEDLKATKSSIDAQIEAEEAEKTRLQREVERMSSKISQLNESLGKKSAARTDYERTIQETESAYMKILESSQLLLNMVKREAACLDQTLSSSASSSIDGDIARGGNGKKDFWDDGDLCYKSSDHIKKKKAGDVIVKT